MNLAEVLLALLIVSAFWVLLAAALRGWVGLGWPTTILFTALYGLGLWILVWYGARALLAQERPYVPAPMRQRRAREAASAFATASGAPEKILVSASATHVDASRVGTALLAERSEVGINESLVRAQPSAHAESDAESTTTSEVVRAEPRHSTNWAAIILVVGVLGLAIGGGVGALVTSATTTHEVVPQSCLQALDSYQHTIDKLGAARVTFYSRHNVLVREAARYVLVQNGDGRYDTTASDVVEAIERADAVDGDGDYSFIQQLNLSADDSCRAAAKQP